MKKYFFSGLALFLPFAITFFIVIWLIRFTTEPFDLLVGKFLDEVHLFENGVGILSRKHIIPIISKMLVLLAIVFLIFIIGFIGQRLSSQAITTFLDNFFNKIPFINKIYSTCKDFTSLLFSSKEDEMARKSAALVPYPSSTQKSMGLVMQKIELDISSDLKGEFVLVLIPCTPNATTGYLCLFPKNAVTFLKTESNQAMRYILSCGNTPFPE